MKKILLIIALLYSTGSFAQFELTHEGFKASADKSKDYIVIDIPGVSASELYKRANQYVNLTYNNPKFVSSNIENEQLVIDALGGNLIKVIFRLSGSNLWRLEYKYDIQFKDGKVRFKPLFKSLNNEDDAAEITLIGISALGNATGMYNKSGKPLREKAIEQVNAQVNADFEKIKKAVMQGVTSDDW